MELSWEKGGISFKMTVDTPSEAAQLIELLGNETGGDVEQPPTLDQPNDDDVFADAIQPSGSVEAVIMSLRGTKTAKFLACLADIPAGARDHVIKEKLSVNGQKVALSGLVSSVTKACKREGVNVPEVLDRRSKRIGAGKVLYFYKLTPPAISVVKSVEDFELDDVFDAPVFDDPAPTDARDDFDAIVTTPNGSSIIEEKSNGRIVKTSHPWEPHVSNDSQDVPF